MLSRQASLRPRIGGAGSGASRRHPPDGVADVVRHQQRAACVQCHPHRYLQDGVDRQLQHQEQRDRRGSSGETLLRLDPGDWWVWVLLFFADDFSYYWFHRISHESRGFWASHVVHHSSRHYNLSTALRQTWVPMTYFPFWLWMPAVGFEP